MQALIDNIGESKESERSDSCTVLYYKKVKFQVLVPSVKLLPTSGDGNNLHQIFQGVTLQSTECEDHPGLILQAEEVM